MALPGPGVPLSINMIRNELGTSSGSLRYLSSLAGFSTPDAISEFYNYSSGYTLDVTLYTLISGVQPQFEYYNSNSGYNVYVDIYNPGGSLSGIQAGNSFDQLAYVNSAYTQDIYVTVYLNSGYIYGTYAYTDFLNADAYGLFTMPASNSSIQIYIEN